MSITFSTSLPETEQPAVSPLTTIRKRDGRTVPFEQDKITQAILKAALACGKTQQYAERAAELAQEVQTQLAQHERTEHEQPGVEEIQDSVEAVLMQRGEVEIARAYILYRAERTRVRERQTRLMKAYHDFTFKSATDDDRKRENANINGDTAMGTMLHYGSEGARTFNELFVLNPAHAQAHKNGEIHIHDLDFLTLTTTCCQIDIERLFDHGFSTGHGFLREPNDIQSYASLACIAIQSNQNDQHGGQSIPNFDYGMAHGVAKTYAHHYTHKLVEALELLDEQVEPQAIVDEVQKQIWQQYQLRPTLVPDETYQQEETERLLAHYKDAALIARVQTFAREHARKETERATYQAMEALIHNLNTMHSRAGAQIPFSSLNYGTDTSAEGRLAMKSILLATEAGLGNGETPIFPIQIFKVKEGVNYNPGDPNYDLFQLSCRVSAKRLFPNFSFLDAPYNAQYYKEGHPETEIAYMGCRTRVIGNVYDPTHETVYGRGNLSFTTVNLPGLALQSHRDVETFFTQLDQRIDLVIAQLLERYEIQAHKLVKNYPFLMGQGIWLDSEKLGWEDEVGKVLKHGTLSMGFIGLAECLKALIGQHHGESPEAQALGLRIIGHMRDRMDEAAQQHKMNFSLLATPAEGTAGRFVKIDRPNYGSIAGVTDREYYTNSFHIPVYYPIRAYDKLRLEAPYHALTNGGHISYVELDGDPTNNLPAFEKIIRAMKELGIGYGSINHPVDRDPVCGFTGIIGETCPRCGRAEGDVHFERIRRITGYLVGTLDRFNDAKKAEVRDRVKHC